MKTKTLLLLIATIAIGINSSQAMLNKEELISVKKDLTTTTLTQNIQEQIPNAKIDGEAEEGTLKLSDLKDVEQLKTTTSLLGQSIDFYDDIFIHIRSNINEDWRKKIEEQLKVIRSKMGRDGEIRLEKGSTISLQGYVNPLLNDVESFRLMLISGIDNALD